MAFDITTDIVKFCAFVCTRFTSKNGFNQSTLAFSKQQDNKHTKSSGKNSLNSLKDKQRFPHLFTERKLFLALH